MRPLPLIVIACTLGCPAALAVDREFNDIVQAISDEFRTRPTRIPLFGLVNAFTFVVRPAGASHIDLAVFDHLSVRRQDGRDLDQAIQRAVGRGWTPFVQVHSHRHGSDDVVLVYMRTEGHNCRLLVTSIERDEATVVQLKLNPEGLQRWISAPQESAHWAHRNRSGAGDE
jgi:hypothetical protein